MSEPNQHSLLHLNAEARLFSFNRLRRRICDEALFFFLMLHIYCCHYAPNVSYLLAWGPNILMNKVSSLWHSCYIFDNASLKKLQFTSLHMSEPNQHSLLHLNAEARLFSFNRLRRRICDEALFFFLMLHIYCCHYAPNVSYLLAWGPNILMNKVSSLWHSCYIFDNASLKKLFYM